MTRRREFAAGRAPVWRRAGIVLLAIASASVLLVFVTLALPVQEWRSGDQGLMPLDYPAAPPLSGTTRLWIDTDAACGASPTSDPDDCLAIALLLASRRFEIAGIATTFGNAARDVVDTTLAALLDAARPQAGRDVPRFSGASVALAPHASATPASDALARALEQGPLRILALGPLTNVAQTLRARPDLAPRVVQVVAVMGRRPGHLFHPAAGARARSFLGHGPVMRDFNYALDPSAVEAVLATRTPLTLVPYDAAVNVELGADALRALATTGPAMRWATERAQGWLGYWTRDMGRSGFFPFDLVAAAYLLQPGAFGCAPVHAEVTTDPRLFLPPFRPRALLVDAAGHHNALYCGRTDATLLAQLLHPVQPR